ncbi:trypsin alpha-3-like [Hermetia illucens]|uniref:trypsin alpha-3-like n=1 Tax=Hermetia illucens TaxID=343691 RepID=UPI0018CC1D8A|nr:trypsin alpha-3-like [Hermetia illucens]
MIILKCFAFMLFALLKIQAKNSTRIINGSNAKLGQFPSIVIIQSHTSSRFLCGGTLATLRYVLSAAHCFRHVSIKSLVIKTGVVRRMTLVPWSQIFSVVAIKSHELYSPGYTRFDYALLKLNKEAVKTRVVYPLPLATSRPENATKCQTAGWGVQSEYSEHFSRYLKYVDIYLIDYETCISTFPFPVQNESQICAGVPGRKYDACQGDSGGPLICDGVVAGIVSTGIGCARKGYYGIYADVAAEKCWIDTNIRAWEEASVDGSKPLAMALDIYQGLSFPVYIIYFNFN